MRATTAIAVGLIAAGCGGASSEPTTPNTSVATSEHHPPGESADGVMIPPDSIDEVNRALGRKRQVVSRCLSFAIDNKELPKGAAGKVTLEISIAPNGKASLVRVVRATLESELLSKCVVERVQEIQFPELPKQLDTSYTYGFEAM